MITESRLKDGTLTLGDAPGLDFSCQVINARVNTSYEDDGSAQETLCGDVISVGRKLVAVARRDVHPGLDRARVDHRLLLRP